MNKYLTSTVLTVVIAAGAGTVLAVSGGSAKARSAATSGVTTVAVRTTSLGRTLVGPSGRTLYLFEGDKHNVSRLSHAGLAVWPRLIASGTVKAGSGVQAAKLGMVTDPRGVRQVTYNGHPLYYFVGDSRPGSVRGEGLNEFGARWYVLGPAGNATTHAPRAATRPASAPAAPAPSYGY